MIERRKFLKLLGVSVAGAAVTQTIPDFLFPPATAETQVAAVGYRVITPAMVAEMVKKLIAEEYATSNYAVAIDSTKELHS